MTKMAAKKDIEETLQMMEDFICKFQENLPQSDRCTIPVLGKQVCREASTPESGTALPDGASAPRLLHSGVVRRENTAFHHPGGMLAVETSCATQHTVAEEAQLGARSRRVAADATSVHKLPQCRHPLQRR